jgi:Flp pilus assembly pilin Flp
MRVTVRDRDDQGVSSVEYAIIIAGISLILLVVVALLGGNLSSALCGTSKLLGLSQNCSTSTAAATTTPTPSSTATGDSGGAGSGTGTGGGSGSGGSSGSTGLSGDSSSSAATTASATNSAGYLRFNTAVIDQDSITSDLSVRVNLSWYPNSWSDVSYPQTNTIDVTWSPALAVDQVITGTDGAWTYTVVGDGHLRLTRTGSFDTSGFQPEPEILLKKPSTTQQVTVSFSASAPNSPTLTASSSTTSVPYK